MRSRSRSLLSALGCLVWAACAAPSAQSGASGATVTTAEPTPTRLPVDWHSMTHDERKAYMQRAVVPAMEPLFAAHDARRFGGFGCRTCHGARARERGYAMPNPELPTLYPTGTAEQRAAVERHRETARFMHQKVTPGMRELLGAPVYDPTTGQGFSCFRCHPRGEPVRPPAQGSAS